MANWSTPDRRIFLSFFAAVASGCAVGPEYVKPALDVPKSLTRDLLEVTHPEGAIAGKWWKLFGSEALDRLVEEALARNSTIDAAVATLEVARQNVIAQRGFFFPTVNAGYNVTRQNVGQTQSPPLASGDTIYTFHTSQLNVGFNPDVFGGNRRQVEGLEATREGLQYQLDAARLTLASNMAGAVLQAAMLNEQSTLIEEATAAMQEQLRYMRNLQRQGYSSGIDVAAQENLLTQIQQVLPPLQKQLEQTRNLISVLAGRNPNGPLPRISLNDVATPQVPAAIASEILGQRPDIRAAETQVKAASAAIGVAKAARFPQLTLTAALGGGASLLADMFSAGNTTWAIGAGLLQPVFSGGTLSARQRAAEAQLVVAMAQYRSTVKSAFQNVADALYALDIDTHALKVAQASESATGSTNKLVQSQLRAGYVSRPAALAAQQAWLQAQAARVAAYGALLGDTVALFQALGGQASFATRPAS